MLKHNFLSNNFRNDGIDMLRGFSILSVILLHCYIHMSLANNFIPLRLTNIIFRSGYYGVIIFFVISGFLITTISLKRWGNLQNISCRQFYRMRFARIMPCLLILLLVLSILDRIGISGFVIQTTSLSQALFSVLTFQVNLLEAKTGYLPANWDILWSLSVEEIFYLCFPLLCLTLKKSYYFVLAMMVLVIAGPFARTWTDNEIWSDHSYLSCIDGIAIGCLAALFSYYYKLNKKMVSALLFSGVTLFSFIFLFRKQAYDMGLSQIGLNVTLLEISIGLILIAMQEGYIQNRGLSHVWNIPIRWFGKNSYEIYLTHSFIVIAFARLAFDTQQSNFLILIWYVMVLVLSGIMGQFVSSYLSEPLNSLIRRKMSFADEKSRVVV